MSIMTLMMPLWLSLACVVTLTGAVSEAEPGTSDVNSWQNQEPLPGLSSEKFVAGELLTATGDPLWVLNENATLEPVPLTSSCKAFTEVFGKAAAQFTYCMITHARPLHFCEHCVEAYVKAKSRYKQLMEADEGGARCRDIILNSDSVQLTVQAAKFMDDVWEDCKCAHCFQQYGEDNGTIFFQLNNRTLAFQLMALEVQECFKNHSQGSLDPFTAANSTNSTVCKNCLHIYKKLNELYEDIEDHSNHHVCMDLADTMNYTRLMWSQKFKCSQQRADLAPVLIVSALFCLLPIVFYIGNKVHGTKLQNKIMKQKRLRDVAASMSEPHS